VILPCVWALTAGNVTKICPSMNTGMYKSFTDLECALKIFQQDNYVKLYRRSSRKIGTGSKYKNMEVAESAAT
jgi:hypothetical protein